MTTVTSRPTHVTGIRVFPSPSADIEVYALGAAPMAQVWGSPYVILEIHYGRGTRAPRVGETLGVWVDVGTPYAMAPRVAS